MWLQVLPPFEIISMKALADDEALVWLDDVGSGGVVTTKAGAALSVEALHSGCAGMPLTVSATGVAPPAAWGRRGSWEPARRQSR